MLVHYNDQQLVEGMTAASIMKWCKGLVGFSERLVTTYKTTRRHNREGNNPSL